MSLSSSVERTLDVLELLGEGRERTLSECSDALDIPKSTLSGLLKALRRRGYVTRDRDGRYRLGVQCLNLGNAFLEAVDIRTVALPVMREVSSRTQHTCTLCVADGHLAAIVVATEGDTPFRVLTRKAAYGELHTSAVGKCLLAGFDDSELEEHLREHGLRRFTRNTIASPEALERELEEVRRRGYAIDDEEEVEGVRCVGVPILDHAGRVLAALSISALAPQLAPSDAPALAEILAAASREISAQAGYVEQVPEAELALGPR